MFNDLCACLSDYARTNSRTHEKSSLSPAAACALLMMLVLHLNNDNGDADDADTFHSHGQSNLPESMRALSNTPSHPLAYNHFMFSACARVSRAAMLDARLWLWYFSLITLPPSRHPIVCARNIARNAANMTCFGGVFFKIEHARVIPPDRET